MKFWNKAKEVVNAALNAAAGAGQVAVSKVKATVNQLSGKNVEEKLEEYSETYGEILLGFHREIESQKKRLSDLESRTEVIESLQREVRRLTIVAWAAVAITAALGVVLWLTR